MNHRQRAGVAVLSTALVAAIGVWAVAQTSRKGAQDTSAVAAATVNGEKITRGQVVDQLLADQAANLNAGDPLFKGKQRAFAQSVGALVVQKMAAANYQPVTVTKAEIVNWAFTDKPPLLTTTVERMIQERVVLQEAKKQGITLTDAEIKARMTTALDSARKNYKMTGLNDAATLKAIGIRSEYLRSFVTPQLALEKLLKKEASAKGEGASEEVREASHILVQVQPDPADPAKTEKAFTDAKAKIDQIAADIRDKKITFEDAAAQHNADSTKFSRGSLGVFTRGQMVPEFDKAVFSLGKGVVSEPVRTQFGWHLVRVDKLSGDITGPQKAEILQRSLSQKMPQMVQQLMTKAKITNTVPPAPQPQGGMMMGGQ